MSGRSTRIETAVHVLLRVAVCMCFVGHGAFGIRQKIEWLVFFDRFHVPPHLAFAMMPLVGMMDICLGLHALIRPTKFVLVYMVFWGAFTALLRPLSGMPLLEAIERAGNVGPAVALLLSAGPGWLGASKVLSLADAKSRLKLTRTLRWTTGLLMIGHGGLGIGNKPGLIKHWGLLNLPVPNIRAFTRFVGAMETAVGLLVLRWPFVVLLVAISIWKMATEAIFITAGEPFWEWIERSGSYVAPLALALVIIAKPATAVTARTATGHSARPDGKTATGKNNRAVVDSRVTQDDRI